MRSWQSWWPAFQQLGAATSQEPIAGEGLRLAVRSPLGYKLKVQLRITDVMPRQRLALNSDGDLVGHGSVIFEPTGHSARPETIIRIAWAVHTTKVWMNRLAPMAAPVFGWAHGKVMADGERRFQRYLSR